MLKKYYCNYDINYYKEVWFAVYEVGGLANKKKCNSKTDYIIYSKTKLTLKTKLLVTQKRNIDTTNPWLKSLYIYIYIYIYI